MTGIRGGRIIDPVSGKDFIGDLILENGTIKAVGEQLNLDGCEDIIEAAGMAVATCVAPFWSIDMHVHLRDPGFTYKEDILTGAHAAAAGGFTTVVCMANTKPVIDNAETLQYVLNKGKETGIHVLSCACVTKGMQGKELVDMDALRAAGAAGFTDDGISILDEEVLKAALIKAEELQVPVSLHEEDPKLITNNGINRGPVSEKLGIGGSPAEAEITMVERDCRLAEETGSYVNIQHISTAGAVEAVRASKRRGSHVTAEAAPHHFTLTDEAVLTYGTLAKMNPPLRTEADRQAVIEGLKDGTIDMIATDHAPHSIDEKGKPLTEAPSGIVGLETSLALGITELVKPGCLTLMELMRKMSQNPAALYHLPYQGIAEGAPADLVIFAADEEWKPESFCSKAVNTPFKGWNLTGRVHYTICDGKIVYSL